MLLEGYIYMVFNLDLINACTFFIVIIQWVFLTLQLFTTRPSTLPSLPQHPFTHFPTSH